jgi:hypothetical protein
MRGLAVGMRSAEARTNRVTEFAWEEVSYCLDDGDAETRP